MNTVIVPAYNEEDNIEKIIDILTSSMADKIVVVLNGSTDNTHSIVDDLLSDRVELLYFNEKLGYDVPRSVGASYSLSCNSSYTCFVDADMTSISGDIIDEVFFRASYDEIDMLLVNVMTKHGRNNDKNLLTSFIGQLNKNLGVYNDIGYSTPSIGLHCLSMRLLESISINHIAIPPVSLSEAVKKGFNVQSPITLPIDVVSSNIKDETHAKLILDTLIGDCISAWNFYNNDDISSRFLSDRHYIGYHKNRRFDILDLISHA